MTNSYWRVIAERVIAEVIAGQSDWATGTMSQRRALLDRIDVAYPFGERAHHPYKIWLDERRRAMERLGLREPVPTAGELDREALKAAGQMEMLLEML